MAFVKLGIGESARYQRLTGTDTLEQSEKDYSSTRYRIKLQVVSFAVGSLLGIFIMLLAGWAQRSSKSTLDSRIAELQDRRVQKVFNARPEWTPPEAGHRELWKQVLKENQAIAGFIIPLDTTPEQATEVYCLSAFHQLHCLDALSGALFSSSQHSGSNTTSHHAHLKHCIQYLTQGVLCAGDMTLEHTFLFDTPAGWKDIGTGGWGASHTCADWGAILEFAKEQSWEPYRVTGTNAMGG